MHAEMLVPQMPVNHSRRAVGGGYAERRRRLASASQIRQRRFGSYQSAWPCRRQPREVVARPSAATFTGGWWFSQKAGLVRCAARTGTRQTTHRGLTMPGLSSAGVDRRAFLACGRWPAGSGGGTGEAGFSTSPGLRAILMGVLTNRGSGGAGLS